MKCGKQFILVLLVVYSGMASANAFKQKTLDTPATDFSVQALMQAQQSLPAEKSFGMLCMSSDCHCGLSSCKHKDQMAYLVPVHPPVAARTTNDPVVTILMNVLPPHAPLPRPPNH